MHRWISFIPFTHTHNHAFILHNHKNLDWICLLTFWGGIMLRMRIARPTVWDEWNLTWKKLFIIFFCCSFFWTLDSAWNWATELYFDITLSSIFILRFVLFQLLHCICTWTLRRWGRAKRMEMSTRHRRDYSRINQSQIN